MTHTPHEPRAAQATVVAAQVVVVEGGAVSTRALAVVDGRPSELEQAARSIAAATAKARTRDMLRSYVAVFDWLGMLA